MPLKTVNNCLQAVRDGGEYTLSEINARRNNAQEPVNYNQHEYQQIVTEALNKFKGNQKKLDVVIESIDEAYLPQALGKEELLLTLGINCSSANIHPKNSQYQMTGFHNLKDPLQSTGYLSPEEQLAVSYSFGFFDRATLDKKLATMVLEHVIKGNQDEAERLIKLNPACLLVRTQAVDYSKRIIDATPFQAALGAEDSLMWQMMMPYFEFLQEDGQIKSAQATMLQQFNQQFPNSMETSEDEYQTLLAYYNKLAQNLAQAGSDVEKNNIILEFRQIINTEGKTVSSGKHFNMQQLIAAYGAYMDNFDRLASWDNRDMFWQKVIGYVQRQMPANFAQVYCSGIKNVLDNPSDFKRTLSFQDGGNFFPLTVGYALGFDFGCFSWCIGARALGGTGVFGSDRFGPTVGELCEANAKQLSKLKRDLKSHKPEWAQCNCVIC